ncbi:MAG TPA: hypothetical protein VH640_02080 [Bryobacteraceae bacterium]
MKRLLRLCKAAAPDVDGGERIEHWGDSDVLGPEQPRLYRQGAAACCVSPIKLSFVGMKVAQIVEGDGKVQVIS